MASSLMLPAPEPQKGIDPAELALGNPASADDIVIIAKQTEPLDNLPLMTSSQLFQLAVTIDRRRFARAALLSSSSTAPFAKLRDSLLFALSG
jgi:hypothetical protein